MTIFVSCRRNYSAPIAGRIYDRLCIALGISLSDSRFTEIVTIHGV